LLGSFGGGIISVIILVFLAPLLAHVAANFGPPEYFAAGLFGVTLVVSFMYYGVLRVGQTLGHNGVLPPLLAAQLGNIIFLIIGLLLLIRANR